MLLHSYCLVIWLFVSLSILTLCTCKANRKNSQIIEDIERTVDQILSATQRLDGNDLSRRLEVVEGSLYLVTTRIEKIIDWTETYKLSYKLMEDRLSRLETKISTVEESLTKKVDAALNKMDQLVQSVLNFENVNDAKLRKVVNIISETYQLSKDLTTSMNGRQGSGFAMVEGASADRIDEMQKKVLEKLSVFEKETGDRLKELISTGRATLSSCDNLNAEMLNYRDECQTGANKSPNKNQQNQQSHYDDHDYYEEKARRQTIRSSQQQCQINLTSVNEEIANSTRHILAKLENQIARIDNKIDEYSMACRTKSLEPQALQADRFVPQTNPNPQAKTSARRSISPVEKPTDLQKCDYSSDLLSPKNCWELRQEGAKCDGAYIINVGNARMMKVYCDMTDGDGGWTVIMRRGEFNKRIRYPISFDQNWNEYKHGFGDVAGGEFWLGLDTIHKMTVANDSELQVDLEAFDGDFISITYDYFKIGNEQEKYKLSIGKPHPSQQMVGNSLRQHDNHPFTTKDRNNAISQDNCADKLKGGWWFHNCHSAMLTGPYFGLTNRTHASQGIVWFAWKEAQHLKSAQMKIRPKKEERIKSRT